jgi:hypothetical protein
LSIYTFYCRKPDGAAPSFEAYELDGDQAAAAQAAVLLEQHMSASQVEVYDKDRQVLTRSRTKAGAGA